MKSTNILLNYKVYCKKILLEEIHYNNYNNYNILYDGKIR